MTKGNWTLAVLATALPLMLASGADARFLQIDPVGYLADQNLYTYVGNDPTDKTDPKGLWECGSSQNATTGGQKSCQATRKALGVLRGLTPKQRAQLNSKVLARLDKVLGLYGADDKANGVTVNEAAGGESFAHTAGGTTTINLDVRRNGGNVYAVAGLAAHEGSHAVDERELFSGHDPKGPYEQWDSELRSYTIQSQVNHVTGYHGLTSYWDQDATTRENKIFQGAWGSVGYNYPNATWDPAFNAYTDNHQDATW